MTAGFQKGRYRARFAATGADVLRCQRLRHLCFFGEDGVDQDRFDRTWQHMMVEDGAGGPLVCTFRLLSGDDAADGYAGQFYDLARFSRHNGLSIEIGRFCVDPRSPDPHIPRVAWGALAKLVDQVGASHLFGCTSFAGIDPASYAHVFARLSARHIGPTAQRPERKAPLTCALADVSAGDTPQNPVPPLLRTYLAMGGWVSDHAVIDLAMDTLHVFTAVDIAAVPPARAKALRALA